MKCLCLIISLFVAFPLQAAELVMVDQKGCVYCERWEVEIAPIYPKTSEGRYAQLRRVDIRVVEGDVRLMRRVSYTPTFLIVEDGVELARLEGYPGEDFFWPMLGQLLRSVTPYAGDDR